jgi:hypothetical protein
MTGGETERAPVSTVATPRVPLAGPRVRGDPWPRVQGEVRWRGRRSAAALREASHCRRHHLGAGCNVPLERQRLAISSDGGGRDKAMGGGGALSLIASTTSQGMVTRHSVGSTPSPRGLSFVGPPPSLGFLGGMRQAER